jgi:hypothetical protein
VPEKKFEVDKFLPGEETLQSSSTTPSTQSFPEFDQEPDWTCIMSSDEIVWQVINQQFCSFKLK